nr:ATP-dependent Clp protease proteolytic subunit [Treponema pedis]
MKYFAENTGKTEKEVASDMERDFFMSPEEAMQYGIIDSVMNRRKDGSK